MRNCGRAANAKGGPLEVHREEEVPQVSFMVEGTVLREVSTSRGMIALTEGQNGNQPTDHHRLCIPTGINQQGCRTMEIVQ
jgi:hypothetical protein